MDRRQYAVQPSCEMPDRMTSSLQLRKANGVAAFSMAVTTARYAPARTPARRQGSYGASGVAA